MAYFFLIDLDLNNETTVEQEHPEMDKQLYAWIKDNRLRGTCVGSREIKAKARALLNEESGFQASSGWLAGFLPVCDSSVQSALLVALATFYGFESFGYWYGLVHFGFLNFWIFGFYRTRTTEVLGRS